MASNRHLGRIIALQTLYEQDFRRNAGDENCNDPEILSRNIGRYKEMVEDTSFINDIVDGVEKHRVELDTKLQLVATEWPIADIARIDRTILEMGLFELENNVDVPPKVVINEAVELAKAFGGDNSSKFINGVLGTLLRQRIESGQILVETSSPADTVSEAVLPAEAAKSKSKTQKAPVKDKKVSTKAAKK